MNNIWSNCRKSQINCENKPAGQHTIALKTKATAPSVGPMTAPSPHTHLLVRHLGDAILCKCMPKSWKLDVQQIQYTTNWHNSWSLWGRQDCTKHWTLHHLCIGMDCWLPRRIDNIQEWRSFFLSVPGSQRRSITEMTFVWWLFIQLLLCRFAQLRVASHLSSRLYPPSELAPSIESDLKVAIAACEPVWWSAVQCNSVEVVVAASPFYVRGLSFETFLRIFDV